MNTLKKLLTARNIVVGLVLVLNAVAIATGNINLTEALKSLNALMMA